MIGRFPYHSSTRTPYSATLEPGKEEHGVDFSEIRHFKRRELGFKGQCLK